MEINYKGVLCRLGIYRVNGEYKPALYYISSPDDETMYKAGFEELHYGLWGKILKEEEYREIVKMDTEDKFEPKLKIKVETPNPDKLLLLKILELLF